VSTVIQPIVEPVQLTNADATYFTALVPTQITNLVVCNPTAGAAWINVNWIPSGGSVGAANLVVYERYVQPGETWKIGPMIGQVLAVGDKLSMKASAGTTLNVMGSGIAVSGS
jgi:hypothetical protein